MTYTKNRLLKRKIEILKKQKEEIQKAIFSSGENSGCFFLLRDCFLLKEMIGALEDAGYERNSIAFSGIDEYFGGDSQLLLYLVDEMIKVMSSQVEEETVVTSNSQLLEIQQLIGGYIDKIKAQRFNYSHVKVEIKLPFERKMLNTQTKAWLKSEKFEENRFQSPAYMRVSDYKRMVRI